MRCFLSNPFRRLHFSFMLLVASFCLGSSKNSALALEPPARLEATVVSVSSGDTMLVAAAGHRYRVRLEAATAPEGADPATEQARRVLENKLLGHKVRIERLTEVAQRTLLGRVFFNGRSINKEMIDEGWSTYSGQPGQYPVLEQSEATARAACLGRWGMQSSLAEDMPEEVSSADSPANGVPQTASDALTDDDPPQFPNYVPRSSDKSPAEQALSQVTDQLGRVQADVFARARAAQDPQARNEILAEVDYAGQFSSGLLEVAAQHPATEAACWALLLVGQFERGDTEASQQRLAEAIESLTRDHLAREELGHLLLAVRLKPATACDQLALYAQLVEASPHLTVRGYACYLWARQLSPNVAALSAPEVQALWQRAATEFGEVKFGPRTLAEIAQQRLELVPPAGETAEATPANVFDQAN